MKSLSSLILITSCLIFCSCIQKALEAAIPQRAYKKNEVAAVKRVAIVAFDVLQFKPTGMGSKISGHVATLQTSDNRNPVEHELATNLYNDLIQKLKAHGITAVPLNQIVQNQGYLSMYNGKKGSLQEQASANHFQKPYVIRNLLRPTNPDYLFTKDQIKELARQFNVDAIIVARVDFTTEQSDFLGLGLGSIYLSSSFTYHMFDVKTNEQIWFDRGFTGPKSDESIGKVSGMENVATIEKLNRPLALKLYDNFLTR